MTFLFDGARKETTGAGEEEGDTEQQQRGLANMKGRIDTLRAAVGDEAVSSSTARRGWVGGTRQLSNLEPISAREAPSTYEEAGRHGTPPRRTSNIETA